MPAIVVLAVAIAAAILTAIVTDRRARNLFSGLVSHAAVWVAYALTQVVAPLAGVFAKAVLEAFESTQSTFVAVVSKLMREVSGKEIPEELLQGGRSAESLVAFGKALGDQVGPLITAAVTPAGPLDPDEAPARVNQLMGISASFALDDWWDHAVVELASLGQIGWLADLSNAVAGGFGLQTLGRQAMRTLLTSTLREPLQQWANRTYTPTPLTTGQIVDAWQQDLLDDDQVAALLRDRGYSYDRALLLLNLQQKDFTLEQAEQLQRLGLLDEAQLDRIIRRQGYGAIRADLVGRLVRGKRSLALLEEIADQARALYRDGRIAAEELRQLLTEALYRPEEVDLVLVREELARRETRQLSKGEILNAYEQGTFDEQETRAQLRAQRYDDGTIDVLLALQRRQLTPAEIVTAFLGGRLPREEALARLVRRGYSADEADLLLDLRARELSEGQIVDALRRGFLTPQQAQDKLRAIGYTPEAADLIVAISATLVSAGDVQAALLRGLLDPEEARVKLRELGYREADVELLLALRFRLLTSGQVLDAYLAGRIGRGDAEARLLQLGFESPDVALLLDLADRQKAPPPPPS